jgi:UDP-glucose 4-epimerase
MRKNKIEMNFSKTNILVVGGAGFVGSNLVKLLLQNDPSGITIVDNFLSAEMANVPDDPKVRILKGSIADQIILDNIKDEYDYIFHLATYHGNQSSIHDPLMDHANNTYTTLRLFDWVKSFKKVEKIVYSSAGCSVAEKTFDEPEATVEKEITSIKHDSPYSISKIIGEFYSVYYFNQHQLPVVRARFQNVYGPGEILGAGEWRGTPATVWRNVTPTFIWKAMHNEALPLENGGNASRDFIFVEDICRGLMACALKGKKGEVYNIASGKETSIAELAEIINKFTGNKAGVQMLPKRSWDNSGKRYGSTEKSKSELGFAATKDINAGLQETIEWTKQNQKMIGSCIAKHSDKINQTA